MVATVILLATILMLNGFGVMVQRFEQKNQKQKKNGEAPQFTSRCAAGCSVVRIEPVPMVLRGIAISRDHVIPGDRKV